MVELEGWHESCCSKGMLVANDQPKPPKPDPDPEPPNPLPGPEPDEPGPDVIDPMPSKPLWMRNQGATAAN
jgi:hypothetical protein